ncbi:MAG: Gfo/Idh/MocA family oxidoreductase [Fibrobacteraceae bacterium]
MSISGILLGEGHMGRLHKERFIQKGVSIISADGDAGCNDLLKTKADFAVITTPASTHYRYAKQALEAGLSVFIEKPITTSYADAQSLSVIARQKNLSLFVAQSERYHPVFLAFEKKFKEFLNSGEIQEIEFHRKNIENHRGKDVSAAFDISVHDFDLLSALLGKASLQYKVVRKQVSFHSLEAEIQVGNIAVRFFSERHSVHPERFIRAKGKKTLAADLNSPIINAKDAIENEHDAFFEILKNPSKGEKALEGALFAVKLAEDLSRA